MCSRDDQTLLPVTRKTRLCCLAQPSPEQDVNFVRPRPPSLCWKTSCGGCGLLAHSKASAQLLPARGTHFCSLAARPLPAECSAWKGGCSCWSKDTRNCQALTASVLDAAVAQGSATREEAQLLLSGGAGGHPSPPRGGRPRRLRTRSQEAQILRLRLLDVMPRGRA